MISFQIFPEMPLGRTKYCKVRAKTSEFDSQGNFEQETGLAQ
jgi:hypothetical protein